MIERVTLRKLIDGSQWSPPQVIGTERDDDYILRSCDWGVASITPESAVLGQETSARVLDTVWQDRKVTIIGLIIGDTDAIIDGKKEQLKAYLTGGDWCRLGYNGFHLDFFLTAEPLIGNTEKDNNSVYCQFTLTGQCSDPRWYNDNESSAVASQGLPMFRFPLTMTESNPVIFGDYHENGTVGYIYGGTVSVGMIITAVATGTISVLRITAQSAYGKFVLTYRGAMTAGQELRIDTRSGLHKATLDGNDVTSLVSGDWIRIFAGQNYIEPYNPEPDIYVNIGIELNTEPQYEVETL